MANETEFTRGTLSSALVNQSADVVDGEIVGGDAEFTNSDNYPLAEATLDIAAFLASVTAGLTIDLYRVRGDIGTGPGTEDDTAFGYAALSTTDNQTTTDGAEYLGSFVLPAGTAAYRGTISIPLTPGSSRYYVMNNSGQTIDCTPTAMTLHLRPFTYVPGA